MSKIRLFSALLFFLTGYIFADVKIILKYKLNSQQQKLLQTNQLSELDLRLQMMKPFSNYVINSLQNQIGYKVKEISSIATGAHVISIEGNLSQESINNIIDKIRKDPNVQYVEQSRMMYANSVEFNSKYQWDMLNIGDNFESLYSNSYYTQNKKPGESVVVVVIDTGYTPHPNYLDKDYNLSLASIPCGSTIPANGYDDKCYGYQFISSCLLSNELNCDLSHDYLPPRPDGLDLGTYSCSGNNCRVSGGAGNLVKNSYHGSHVAGTIISQGYKESISQSMILGGAYGSKVLPIRSLGMGGGGYDSDIENAILWSIGEYPGIVNSQASQVKVINMSLGGDGVCESSMQDAINMAIRKNVIVVVAAGNEHKDFMTSSPANCKGVISVSAKLPNQLAYYSNFGNTTITASGGSGYVSYDILSTVWGNESVYSYFPSNFNYVFLAGTSMAAPHVSAAVADIVSYLMDKKIAYSNEDIINIIQNSSQTLVVNYSANCNEGGCVPGKTLDAGSALEYTIREFNGYRLTPFVNSESVQLFTIVNNNLQKIRLVNLNYESISVSSAYINDSYIASKLLIESNECNKKILGYNEGCDIFLRLLGYSDFSNISLQMKNFESKIVMNLPININNPLPQQSSSGGGGGCSIAINGDDYSLIILIGVLVVLLIRRNMKKDNF
jgi:serine protease